MSAIFPFVRAWTGAVLNAEPILPRDWRPENPEQRNAVSLEQYRQKRAALPVTPSLRDRGPDDPAAA